MALFQMVSEDEVKEAERLRQLPDSFYNGNGYHHRDDLYSIMGADGRTILAQLWLDGEGDEEEGHSPYDNAAKNAVLFANSYRYEQALKILQEMINHENRDMLNKHPLSELFDKMDTLIEDALDS